MITVEAVESNEAVVVLDRLISIGAADRKELENGVERVEPVVVIGCMKVVEEVDLAELVGPVDWLTLATVGDDVIIFETVESREFTTVLARLVAVEAVNRSYIVLVLHFVMVADVVD